ELVLVGPVRNGKRIRLLENTVIAAACRFDPWGRNNATTVLQNHLPEAPIITQRGIEAAIGQRKAGAVNRDAGALLHSRFLPQLFRQKLRQALARYPFHAKREDICFNGAIRKQLAMGPD